MLRIAAAAAFLAAFLLPAQAEIASCYGPESGTQTASGERFDWHANTAASRTLAFGTWVRVTYQGRSVTVKINDRGPFIKGRTLDLSLGACRRIGLDAPGAAEVTTEIVNKPTLDWRAFR